jgi:glycerol kinase
MSYILALDQGTTSCRSIIFDENCHPVASSQSEFQQIFPKPGWVEHNPREIWSTQLKTFKEVLKKTELGYADLKCIGITNQRETTLLWDRKSGEPVMNAIVWQDKRTAQRCTQWKEQGLESMVAEKTGLVIDSYFSASKLDWMLEHVSGARERAENGELCFGTIDSWLVYCLTDKKIHATDVTNASRTMFFNIHSMEWDEELLETFNIPKSILPEVKPSDGRFGYYEIDEYSIPITGIAGDQQAALLGQGCVARGMAKNTYGTGCFLLMNTGKAVVKSKHQLLSTVAWSIQGETHYALEGAIFVAGAALQWLRDGLEVVEHVGESEALAEKLETNDSVYMVPAFAGLGAPYWDMYARGAIFGLTRDTGVEHFCRAALESLAYRTKDIFGIMEKDSGIDLAELKADGGASANNFLMQFQADILDVVVKRSMDVESTAKGAALVAGIGLGLWDLKNVGEMSSGGREFTPQMSQEQREKYYNGWLNAVKRTLNWLDD